MSGHYAKKTTVTVEKSKAEIEKTLVKYGADGFSSAWEKDKAAISFKIDDRYVRLELGLPQEEEYSHDSRGQRMGEAKARAACDQANRQRWRALLLIIKAKLEAVECGISSIEREFLADVVLPDNTRLGDALMPQIQLAYSNGKMPALLPAPKPRKKGR
jgi:hypothetical protein